MAYKHGTYSNIIPSQELPSPSGVATLPVYIGTAPVDTLEDASGAINTPVLVSSFAECQAKLGYSDDWEKYTLCEAMTAHFMNTIKNIGPIVLINVYDPSLHENGPEDVTKADIIGGIDSATEQRKGLECVNLISQEFNMIPTILLAPGWSSEPDVYNALVVKSQKINGHWDAICLADINTTTVVNIAVAKTWKITNNYTNKFSKIFWPKAQAGDAIYHLSTLAAVRMQQTDFEYDNTPYVSPSNRQIMCNGTVLASGDPIKFDAEQANGLNAVGITTAVFLGGTWRLWGPHMANYDTDSTSIKPEYKTDCSIRMLLWLSNAFQKNYIEQVDGPMSRRAVEIILDDAQVWLNSLIADGKILHGTIAFQEADNPTSSIAEGDFVFDIKTTTTPPGKSLTFNIQYTSDGLSVLFGGDA